MSAWHTTMDSQPYGFSDLQSLDLYGATLAPSDHASPSLALLPPSQGFYGESGSTAVCELEPLPTAEELLLDKVAAPMAAEVDAVASNPIEHAGTRKRKAPTTKDHHWEPLKARIIELHADEKLPVKKLRAMIREETGFDATFVAYHA